MSQHLNFDEFIKLAKTAKRVAIYRSIAADRLTPIAIMESLAEEMQQGSLLESGLQHHSDSRYSFLAFKPIAQLKVQNAQVTQELAGATTTVQTHPFAALRQLQKELNYAKQPLDFITTSVGFMSYDAARLFETIPQQHCVENALPEMLFNFYQIMLTFDHAQQQLILSIIVETTGNLEEIYTKAQEQINQLIKKITGPTQASAAAQTILSKPDTSVTADINDTDFLQLIDKAKKYIISGEVFQIVLSRCFKKSYSATPLNIYRALRRISPAPYMFYLPLGNRVIIGASPEKFISVQQGQVTINPIAGTRPRNATSKDEQLAETLLNDPKERAEHMMLVDLARNDLGKVCQPGSIKIQELTQVKHFSHVSHITSSIHGQLHEDQDAFDALAAAFPAGTLSGAPKIRAMQLINELETSARNLYGGAICRLDNQGNLDSCIAIRMAELQEGVATIRTGAGIVYDSNPQLEADETKHKARAVLTALETAEEEIYDSHY